jgi:DNA processing protein
LAFGVDGEVHRAALINGLPTVGVLANTLPSVSPAAHRGLAADIVSRGGALVTELNSQTKQNGNLYIPRNRIIAGISAGVVVVETPESGGSLSTAAFADGYGRSVMAVPGRATDSNSRGCNMLIRNRKAQAVMSGQDIASELMWELGLPSEPAREREKLPLTDQEQSLMEHFGQEPITIDALQVASGLSLGELSLLLMNLELSGAVRQLPGKQYEKLI